MNAQPKEYDGLKTLVPRIAPIGVLSIGLKREVLQDWARDHPEYKLPKLQPVMFKDPGRFFIKEPKGQGPKGSSAIKRYRPMLAGFERFNLENGEPVGQKRFYGFLAAGEIEWANPEAAPEERRVRAPYFRRQRKAQKLGRMTTKPGGKWEEFERTAAYSPSRGEEAPSGQAECRGDGEEATRWMPDAEGAWGWRQMPCLDDDCPFSGVCKVTSRLDIHSQEKSSGETAFLRYENQSANTTAQLEGFLARMKRETEKFGMSGELYGLPVRLEIVMESKSAGVVRGKQLPARRFPVVRIGEQTNVVGFKSDLAAKLRAGGGTMFLPPAQEMVVSAEEEAASNADFAVDPPGKPRMELVPVDHAKEPEPLEVTAEEVEPALTEDPRSLAEMIQQDYVDAGVPPQKIAKALVAADLKGRGKALPEDADRADVRRILDQLQGEPHE